MSKNVVTVEKKKVDSRIRKLSRMCVLCYKNCIRLHSDSILLFKNGSYPTAYAISIIALEEMGKHNLLSHGLYYGYFDFGSDENFVNTVLSETYIHKAKQRSFMSVELQESFLDDYVLLGDNVELNKTLRESGENIGKTILSTKWGKYFPNSKKLYKKLYMLEYDKHRSLYVGFPKKDKTINLSGRLISPFEFSKKKVKDQITYLNDYLLSDALKVLKGFGGLDFDELEDMITSRYVTKLHKNWPFMAKKNRSRFLKWMKMPNDIDE
jgi:AbiV family abortive infection protein